MIYFIANGCIDLVIDQGTSVVDDHDLRRASRTKKLRQAPLNVKKRAASYRGGGGVGELNFVLRQPRAFSAICKEASLIFCFEPRDALVGMEATHPALALAVHKAILKTVS